jgi:hypothetical protein
VQFIFIYNKQSEAADSGGRSVKGLGLRPLAYRDCGFETRYGHGCPSVVFVVFCVDSGLCDGLIARPEECYRLCVCVCVSLCVI